MEEGDYVDNRKNGNWITYYNNDRVKHEITFQNNRPNGYATFYYKSGKKSEEGIWKNDRWVGEYKYYHENGNLAYEWNYNEQGKREGVQKYYHENGQLMIEGEWQDGKEAGKLVEYYANGDVKQEKYFDNGSIKPEQTQKYERVNPPYVEKKQEEQNIDVAENKPDQPAGVFDGNGYHTLKDKKGRPLRKGEFKDGFLINGEVYQYGADGKKIKTTVYKDQQVVEIIEHE